VSVKLTPKTPGNQQELSGILTRKYAKLPGGLARPGAIDGSERAAQPGANHVPVRARFAEQHDVAHGRVAEKRRSAHAREHRRRERSAPKSRAAELELATQRGHQR